MGLFVFCICFYFAYLTGFLWGSHSGDDSDLLRCDALWSCMWLPTFRRKLSLMLIYCWYKSNHATDILHCVEYEIIGPCMSLKTPTQRADKCSKWKLQTLVRSVFYVIHQFFCAMIRFWENSLRRQSSFGDRTSGLYNIPITHSFYAIPAINAWFIFDFFRQRRFRLHIVKRHDAFDWWTERICKEAIADYFNALSQYFPRETEETQETLQRGEQMSGPRFKSGTYWMRRMDTNH
jgi:hypothetical protein